MSRCMFMSCHKNAGKNLKIKKLNRSFEKGQGPNTWKQWKEIKLTFTKKVATD